MNKPLVAGIRESYIKTLDRISAAATRSGREAETVRLVVVTKSQPLEVVRAAITAGASLLGENYPEEAVEKISALRGSLVEWHMIGHVQSRKSDLVASNFSLLHSLDSLKLAGRLNKDLIESGRKLPVLLEVNVSGEESKFGFPGWNEQTWTDLLPLFKQIIEFPKLVVRGLMTMPPFFTEPDDVRPYFQRLKRFQKFLCDRLPQAEWSELSMGTSADFVTAVEEGATIVRVGQAILGPRPGLRQYD
jgi:pyridoxal phosphate enzyme (YggS family)